MRKKEVVRLDRVTKYYNSYDDFDKYLILFSGKTILANLGKTKKVLELGCASGVMTKMLAAKASSLTVVDGSNHYIRQTKARIKKKNVKFVVSLFEEFDSKNKYDAIIMASILEHVKRPRTILRRMANFLTPNGEIHITVPNAYSIHRQIGKALGLIKNLKEFSDRDRYLGHRRIYDKNKLIKDIKSTGLKVKNYSGIFLKPLSNKQMEYFSRHTLEEFYKAGKLFPDICNYIYVIAKK